MGQKVTLSQKTADTLKQMIEDEIYKVGDQLPNENVLSKQLGISRTTLREAIRILVSDGKLVVERGNGTFVADPLNQSTNTQIDVKNLSITVRDLYETRLIFEPQAAALACKRATDDEIKEILRLGNEVQTWIKKDPAGKERIASESAFHGAIIRAAHNDFLNQFMPIITETIEKTFALKINLEMIAEDAYKDHILIMNFLQNRDADGLKSAVTIHLHHALYHENIVVNL